jgi:hypothetical protein
MEKKGKVKFIRKNGKLIPISGESKKMDKRAKNHESKAKKEGKTVKKFIAGGAALGALSTMFKARSSLVELGVGASIGALAGGLASRAHGSGKRHEYHKKKANDLRDYSTELKKLNKHRKSSV